MTDKIKPALTAVSAYIQFQFTGEAGAVDEVMRHLEAKAKSIAKKHGVRYSGRLCEDSR